MLIRRLALQQFRNYDRLAQEFAPGLNVLVGRNAQGKSSLLEAIYLLATTKSMRGSKDSELIRWDAPSAVVEGRILRTRTSDVDLGISVCQGVRKSLTVNTSATSKTMDFIGQLKVVAFGIIDVDTVRGEPARRRRMLDLEISQLSPSYCHSLACYRKVTEQRNRLLRTMRDRHARDLTAASLESWTDQLISYGGRIIERRRQFLRKLDEYAEPIHDRLTGGRERLSISYTPSFRIDASVDGVEAVSAIFKTALEGVREEELRRQVCLLGPHRDDLVLLVNGRDVRTYGSQGQQRSAALSLKLAEIELMQELAEEPPVCLLDDVFSELDIDRRTHLFEATLERCQVFLTTTELELVPEPIRKQAQAWEVADARLKEIRG